LSTISALSVISNGRGPTGTPLESRVKETPIRMPADSGIYPKNEAAPSVAAVQIPTRQSSQHTLRCSWFSRRIRRPAAALSPVAKEHTLLGAEVMTTFTPQKHSKNTPKTGGHNLLISLISLSLPQSTTCAPNGVVSEFLTWRRLVLRSCLQRLSTNLFLVQ